MPVKVRMVADSDFRPYQSLASDNNASLEGGRAIRTGILHHVAVLQRDYLAALLRGGKTVECRLSRVNRPPRGHVATGDWVWFKQSGGPVRAVARISRILERDSMTPTRLASLRTRYGRAIQAPTSFWESHKSARFATLIWLDNICAIQPFKLPKSDRRAWVVLAAPPVPGRPLITHPAPGEPPGAPCLTHVVERSITP